MNLTSSLVLLGTLLVASALSGCAKSPEALGADANLSFDGTGTGTHSENAKCDSDGRFGGNGHVTDGTVMITVTDADGTTLFSERYEGDFDVPARTLTGDEGMWKVEASRAANDLVGDDFSGRYAFFVNC